jgi:hypothetical protein
VQSQWKTLSDSFESFNKPSTSAAEPEAVPPQMNIRVDTIEEPSTSSTEDARPDIYKQK